jgi:hypothetical protein
MHVLVVRDHDQRGGQWTAVELLQTYLLRLLAWASTTPDHDRTIIYVE